MYPVQRYPPHITARDGRRLVATPLRGGETPCARCKRELTIVGYRDPRANRTWPTCLACARKAASTRPPVYGPVNPYEFVLYRTTSSASESDLRASYSSRERRTFPIPQWGEDP